MSNADINWKEIGNKLQNYINNEKSELNTNQDKTSYGNKNSIWINKETFLKQVSQNEDLFSIIDRNSDGLISESECEVLLMSDNNQDGEISDTEYLAMQEAVFFARRTIDKWFSLDIDRDGYWSNVECKLGDYRMWNKAATYQGLDSSMTNEELAKKYNMQESLDNTPTTLDGWIDGWLNECINDEYRETTGANLNEKQKIFLKQEMIKQLNTWLFKTGDNATKNAPLYNSLNNTAYTRLITDEQTVSCCGGDIIPPPTEDNKNSSCVKIFSALGPKNKEESIKVLKVCIKRVYESENKNPVLKFGVHKIKTREQLNKILENLSTIEEINEFIRQNEDVFTDKVSRELKLYYSNTACEVKNRLAWAMFRTPPKEELALNSWDLMTEEEQSLYEDKKEILSQITINDLENLMEPENKDAKEEFEQKNNISVEKIYNIIADRTIWFKMTDDDYKKYHEQYEKMRKMTSQDFRNLLNPDNKVQKEEFEQNSGMSVEQIIQYIDIIETEIGQGNFDKNNWTIDAEQYYQITLKINDTSKDEQLLDSKTYEDVPQNRQKLLKFLEEKNWLLPQLQKGNIAELGFSLNKFLS